MYGRFYKKSLERIFIPVGFLKGRNESTAENEVVAVQQQ